MEEYIRRNKHECPTCRTHIQSRRYLRRDPHFDELVKAIYGDIGRYEDEVRRAQG